VVGESSVIPSHPCRTSQTACESSVLNFPSLDLFPCAVLPDKRESPLTRTSIARREPFHRYFRNMD